MDEILAHALRIACVVRDSAEGSLWRKAWQILSEDFVDMSSLITAPIGEIPIAAHMRAIRVSEQAQSRPTMFPLLVVKFPYIKSIDQIRTGLHNYPREWRAFENLRNCMRLMAVLIEYLRVIAPGYPFEELIYSTPGTHWREISSMNELPWGFGEQLLANKSTDARFIGLKRFVPTVADTVAQAIYPLSAAIMRSLEWQTLKQSYETVMDHPKIAEELIRARVFFEKELEKTPRPKYPSQQWIETVEDLAQRVYAKKGQRIGRYIDAFRKYQELVEHIYWILSQVIIYEKISSITSQNPDQLQQISLSESPLPVLTAISLTGAKTLDVGQLIHISLPATNHLLDGLYQVEHEHVRFDIPSGTRTLFRARRLWQCHLDEVVSATKGFGNNTIVESEHSKGGDDYKIVIGNPDEGKILEAGNPITEFDFHKTMYLI
jgi:hypothetical protein